MLEFPQVSSLLLEWTEINCWLDSNFGL
jgi:hypothetical protein